jgi:hypothetical protein
MRELTVRIRFTNYCLGNQKAKDGSGRFEFMRSPDGKNVLFLASWHKANMRSAAQLLGRYGEEVKGIFWDINVDGNLRDEKWHRAYYVSPKSKQRRYSLHEAFFIGQEVSFNCCVPSSIPDDDFWRLMAKAGQYRGISPWKPGEYGNFEVVQIRPRKNPNQDDEGVKEMPGEFLAQNRVKT